MTQSLPPASLPHQVFAHLHLAVVVLRDDGMIEGANPAFARFCGVDSVPGGESLASVAPDLAKNKLFKTALQRLRSNHTLLGDAEFEIGEGAGERLVRMTAQMLGDESTNILVILEDITHTRELETPLLTEQQHKTVERLAGGIAHDFNNILTVIQSFSTFLIDGGYEDDAEVVEIGQTILDSSERAAQLTRQLLAFARKQVFDFKSFDLNAALESLVPALESVTRADTTLVLEPLAETVFVHADSSQLQQVIVDLVVNAQEATVGAGTITVSIRPPDDDANASVNEPGEWIVISVADDGVGLDPEVRGRMFEPFYTTKTFGNGVGMGLSAAYGTIKQLGGFLTADSRPGGGTAFSIYLQTTDPPPNVAPSSPRKRDHTASILLVEDNDLVRAATHRVLRHAGYRVIEESNGRRAIDMLNRHNDVIDILVTDVMMPELSGPELATQLLADPRYRGLKVIFTSGHGEEHALSSATIGEGISFLQKPYTPRELIDAIQHLDK